jgi:hypothetical protein
MSPVTDWPRKKMVDVRESVTQLGSIIQGPNAFPGGLDQTTPSQALQSGALREGSNFEVMLTGGYGRIGGYERYSGRPSPSDASWIIVQVASFTNVPTTGQVITQAGSGATGTVVTTSSSAAGDYIVVTKVTGVFNETGAITTPGPIAIGTATTTSVSISIEDRARYTAAAADIYRADILAVPGSGRILGVVAMTFAGADNVYAFRNNAGGTAAAIYKASPTGWVSVPLLNIVNFTLGGTAEPQDGQTLIKGAVNAVIKRVVTQSAATWAGAAAGYFVIANPTGGNFSAGAATVTVSGATVTLSGIQTAITILPNGRYQFDKGNFAGQEATQRIYGCDNVNKGFEFDGEAYVPITTGLPDDKPTNVAVHKGHLFFTYASSLLFSGPGAPFLWLPINGGGEIATGSIIAAITRLPGSEQTATLGVYHASHTQMLYGTDDTDWNLVNYNTSNGARRYSVQNIFDVFVFDDLGVITQQASLNFGNFAASTMTSNVLPFILENRTRLSASSINRTKGQYRVFFSTGAGLYVTTSNQRYLGSIPVYFPNPVHVIDEQTTSEGEEVIYFGSSDTLGYIYQLDKGSSFDGAVIPAYITMAWDFLRSPRVDKRYRRATVEIQGEAWAGFQFGYRLGYGTPLINQPGEVGYESSFAPAPLWDEFTWDDFVWDGQTLTPTTTDLVGTSENIQVTISSGTNYILPYTVNSVIYQYSMRRGLR